MNSPVNQRRVRLYPSPADVADADAPAAHSRSGDGRSPSATPSASATKVGSRRTVRSGHGAQGPPVWLVRASGPRASRREAALRLRPHRELAGEVLRRRKLFGEVESFSSARFDHRRRQPIRRGRRRRLRGRDGEGEAADSGRHRRRWAAPRRRSWIWWTIEGERIAAWRDWKDGFVRSCRENSRLRPGLSKQGRPGYVAVLVVRRRAPASAAAGTPPGLERLAHRLIASANERPPPPSAPPAPARVLHGARSAPAESAAAPLRRSRCARAPPSPSPSPPSFEGAASSPSPPPSAAGGLGGRVPDVILVEHLVLPIVETDLPSRRSGCRAYRVANGSPSSPRSAQRGHGAEVAAVRLEVHVAAADEVERRTRRRGQSWRPRRRSAPSDPSRSGRWARARGSIERDAAPGVARSRARGRGRRWRSHSDGAAVKVVLDPYDSRLGWSETARPGA